MDRAGEAFIGREAFRTEIMALAGSALLTGAGLILLGASRLGAPIAEITALHVALMGGLGMSVLMVLSIAGLLHSGATFFWAAAFLFWLRDYWPFLRSLDRPVTVIFADLRS